MRLSGGVPMESNRAVILQDMRTSMACVDMARPVISKLLRGGRILPVEGSDDEVCKMLDVTCGTDYFQVYDKSGLVYGVASRVQYTKNYRSFTIRKARQSGVETEFEKRKRAVERGGIYPVLTMQMYTDGQKIHGLAIVKTVDLIAFVDRGCAVERKTGTDKVGQASFYVCYWDDMRKAGYNVLEA